MGAPDPLAGKTIGGFRLERLLGRGAMAAVYAATTPTGGRVALKIPIGEAARDRELIRRFEREARIGAMVTHPYLCPIVKSGVDRGIRWLAMAHIDGQPLDDRIDAHGPMPWREAATLLARAGEAIACLHRAGIIHRDLKPGNLLVGADGSPSVIDLGFAKIPGEAADAEGSGSAELTVTGVALGSPAYMPPEQVSDAKSVTPAADVYALAATFFHAVAGTPPFHGGGSLQVMTKVLRDPAPRLRSLRPDIPAGVDRLVARCLEKNPALRPKDASAWLEHWQAMIADPDRAPGGGGFMQFLRRIFGRR